MPKSVNRQQRRLAQRRSEKRKESSERAKVISARRVTAQDAWRNRHLIPRSPWQKFTLGCKVLFEVFGGPLIWWMDTPNWSRKLDQPPKN